MGQLYHRTTLLLIYLWTFLIVTDLSILSFFLILDIQHLAPLAWFPSHGPQKTLLRASKGLKRGVWAVTWLINHPLHRVYSILSVKSLLIKTLTFHPTETRADGELWRAICKHPIGQGRHSPNHDWLNCDRYFSTEEYKAKFVPLGTRTEDGIPCN